jgi:hypothetical protein
MYPTEELRTRNATQDSSWTVEQRAAIMKVADEILADPSFKKSRRCVVLFRRLIEHSLDEGDEDGIKERTLGIEVFGREADYDTNTDPIVRMTANEIRKRLAQYYQSHNGVCEVQIRLNPGNYLPRFDFPIKDPSFDTSPKVPTEAVHPDPFIPEPVLPGSFMPQVSRIGAQSTNRLGRVTWLVTWIVAAAAIISVLFWVYSARHSRSTLHSVWAPLLDTPEPILICVAGMTRDYLSDEDWSQHLASMIAGQHLSPNPARNSEAQLTNYTDSEVAMRVAGWLGSQNKSFKVASTSVTTLEDFRHGPVLLLGAFDNRWNLILLSNLRYSVRIDPVTKDEWIQDSQNPSKRDWMGSWNLLYADSSTDFAIITRVFDRDTGNWILAAGGLGMHATQAAGDLLTDTRLSQYLPAALRSSKQNFQIVLKTTVIDGHTGAPQILAVYTW